MAASFVAADGLDVSSTTSTWTLTFSNIVPASGDIVVLAACWTQSRTISSVQDNLSASWTALDGGYNSGEARGAFYYKVLSGSETSVTLTLSGGGSGYIAAVQLTGVASSSVLDAADIDNFADPTQTPATASVSSTADGIAVAAIGTYFVSNFAPSSANSFSNSFVKRLDSADVQGTVARSGVIFGTLVYTGSGSRSTTLTTTDSGDEAWAGIALFKAASGGATEISASIGAATASGSAATVSIAQTISAGIGSATGTGLLATVSIDSSISAGIGAAVGAGLSAALSADTVISGTVGAATASGLTAALDGSTSIAAEIGAATASGLAATVSSDIIIPGGIGAGTANGLAASISVGNVISAEIGAGTATGLSATVSGDFILSAAIAAGVANGLTAGVITGGNTTVTAGIGAAVAEGLQVQVLTGLGKVRLKAGSWIRYRAISP